MQSTIVVFTRDLRVRDNPALHTAVASAGPTIGLFVYDPEALDRHQSPNRLAYLEESLTDLAHSLSRRDVGLEVERSNRAWTAEIQAAAAHHDAATVHITRDYSLFARRRTAQLRTTLERDGVELVEHPGVAVVEPGRVHPAERDHYAIFTPFYRRWRETEWGVPLPAPRNAGTDVAAIALPAGGESSTSPGRELGGETAALARLARWARSDLAHYSEFHDALAADRTSRISAALHFGCLSPREVAVRLRDRPGAEAFVRQIAWRDFYLQLLAARPGTAIDDVRPRSFQWRSSAKDFETWCRGDTGFPIVDAAMRQLRAEGFVHNRARMVAASFLTKDLAIDWRLGAAEYMRWLTDGDIAQNQLNWQWVAGTGTDSNPHRIFNPTRQSQRFDADGAYIRRYVPELRDVAREEIHEPNPLTRAMVGYPAPMVDHAEAIAEYRARRG